LLHISGDSGLLPLSAGQKHPEFVPRLRRLEFGDHVPVDQMQFMRFSGKTWEQQFKPSLSFDVA